MNILLQYWKYVLVFGFLLLFSVSLGWMKISNTNLKHTIELQKKDLIKIAEDREQNAKDYKIAIDEYTINIKHRDVVFKTRTEKIYIWEDKNESCQDVINRFDNYTF